VERIYFFFVTVVFFSVVLVFFGAATWRWKVSAENGKTAWDGFI